MSLIREDIIKEIIDKDLYPEKRFPRSLFPDLVSILTELYRNDNNGDEISDPIPFETKKKIFEKVSLKALLDHNPGTLILIYKTLIFKYIFKRNRNKDDVEEIVQEIITRFLQDKINGIRRRFNFENPELPTFTSYFLVTIRNIYIDIIRKESREKSLVENEMDIETISDNNRGDMLNTLIIEEEFRKFNALLKLYHKTAPKLSLALKLKYNIPADDADILSCFPDCSDDDKKLLLRSNGFFIKNRISIETLASIFNKYEGKSNNPDTLRKWISTKIEEIKRHMNHIHKKSPYNNSTISDLIILYFKWQKRGGVYYDQ